MPTPPAVLTRMQDHVLEVAGDHDVTVYLFTGSWTWSEAYPEDRTVTVPTVRQPSDYLLGLHELGHVLDPLAVSLVDETDHRSILLSESAAWAFAQTTIRPAFVPHIRAKDWDLVAYAWRTYLAEGAGNGWRKDGKRLPRTSPGHP